MRIPLLLLLVVCGTSGLARADGPPPAKPKPGPKWVFQALPRSFQRRPQLDIWVFTERTAQGQQLRAPSPDEPTYYVGESGGYHVLGEQVREKPPTANALARVVRSALKNQGLVPADETNPASLLLVYTWGSHNREKILGGPLIGLDEFPDGSMATINYSGPRGDMVAGPYSGYPANLSDASGISLPHRRPVERGVTWSDDTLAPMRKTDQIERAALLVGDAFARNFRQEVANLPEDDGENGPVMRRLFQSAMVHPRGRFLCQSINDSLYFVVVTAYDAARVAQGRRDPLWRTKIAVTSDGISLVETMPSLLVVAAPYMGRDTGAGALLRRQLDRRGNVVIGEPEVIGWETGESAQPPKPEGAKP